MGDMFNIYGEDANYIKNLVSKSGRMRILGGTKLNEGQNGFSELNV
jgi:hypothetical protein